MATNSNPISVAPADALTMMKFSQPWNILALKPEAAFFYGDNTPRTLAPRLCSRISCDHSHLEVRLGERRNVLPVRQAVEE
jgi:hypothetical protein